LGETISIFLNGIHQVHVIIVSGEFNVEGKHP
jgi:hypothetical protein